MKVFFQCLFLLLCVACSENNPPELFTAAQLLKHGKAGEAKNLLKQLQSEHFSSQTGARYALLLLEAGEQSGVTVPEDSLVHRVWEYYSEVKRPAQEYMKACYYAALHAGASGESEEAAEAFIQAEKVAKEKGNDVFLGKIYKEWGNLYFNRGDYKQAKLKNRLALQYFRMGKDFAACNNVLSTLGTLFYVSGRQDSSDLYFNRALAMAERRKDTITAALTYHNLGVRELHHGNSEKARWYVTKACRLTPQNTNIATCYLLAEICRQENKLDSALYFIDIALERYAHHKKDSIWGFCNRIEIYAKKEKARQTLYSASRLIQLQEEIYEDYTRYSVWRAEQKYRLKEIRMELRQMKLWAFIGGSVFMIAGIVLYSVFLLRKNRKIRELGQEILLKNNQLEQLECLSLSLGEKDKQLKEWLSRKIEKTRKAMNRCACACRPEDYQKIVAEAFAMDGWEEFQECIDHLYQNLAGRIRQDIPELTETEVRHCCLACVGFSTKEIASYMKISEGRVNTRRSEIMKKVNARRFVGNFSDFIRYYRKPEAEDRM